MKRAGQQNLSRIARGLPPRPDLVLPERLDAVSFRQTLLPPRGHQVNVGPVADPFDADEQAARELGLDMCSSGEVPYDVAEF